MKMQEIDDFLNRTGLQTSRKQSKLQPFADEIFELKRRGYSQVVILQFLKECKNLDVSQQALNYFIHSRLAQNQANTPQKTATNAPIVPTPEPTPNVQENAPVRRGLRKPAPTRPFNWDDKRDPESLK